MDTQNEDMNEQRSEAMYAIIRGEPSAAPNPPVAVADSRESAIEYIESIRDDAFIEGRDVGEWESVSPTSGKFRYMGEVEEVFFYFEVQGVDTEVATLTDQQPDQVEREEFSVLDTTDSTDESRDLFEDLTAAQVAAGSWILAAGCYGYLAAEYGNPAFAGLYPENAFVFILFGVGLGVGIAATLVTFQHGDTGE